MNGFMTPETTLAHALGVPRKVIKAMRADTLEQGTHWDYAPGGAVCFSQAGIEKTLEHLSIAPEKIATLLSTPSGEAAAATAVDSPPNEPPLDLAEPDMVEVTVTRCYTVNRRLVAGMIGEAPVRVKVKSNEKLRAGMTLRCRCVEDDLYELAERLPRWPSKR